jgi:hypothetical protein
MSTPPWTAFTLVAYGFGVVTLNKNFSPTNVLPACYINFLLKVHSLKVTRF